MNHKLGLKLWSTNTDYYYDEAIRLYNKNIFSYIELYAIPGTSSTIEKWAKLNIPFIIHAPHYAHGLNLSKKEYENKNIEIYKESKLFADKLNAQYIIFHTGTSGEITETARQLKILADDRIVIENKPKTGNPNNDGVSVPCVGYSVEEIKYVLDTVGCGFCLDFGHAICAANSTNKEPYNFIKQMIELKPTMYHLSDENSIDTELDHHLHLGKGAIDIKRILSDIPRNSIITIETDKDSKTSLDDFTLDVEYLTKSLISCDQREYLQVSDFESDVCPQSVTSCDLKRL